MPDFVWEEFWLDQEINDRGILLDMNLVENAIKYNKPAGRAEICVRKQNGEITVVIADTGLGVPEEQRTLIFEPFYRVDRSRSRRIGGNGLGLSIVRRIARQYGGDATVGDSPLGGACFVIHLPLSKSG